MFIYQITPQRLRILENRWRSTINRFRGAIPAGLGIIHIAAFSDGEETPKVRDAKQHPVGLMQVPIRTGVEFNHLEEDLLIPTNNIYVWAAKTNKDAIALHQKYPNLWTKPNYDFWVTVHARWILERHLDALIIAADADQTPDQIIDTIKKWLDTDPAALHARTGPYGYTELKKITDYLNTVQVAIITLDGIICPSETFGSAKVANPGSVLNVLKTGAKSKGTA